MKRRTLSDINARLTVNPNDIARTMLAKLDPTMGVLFESIRKRASKFAEDQPKHGMCRDGGAYTRITEQLTGTRCSGGCSPTCSATR